MTKIAEIGPFSVLELEKRIAEEHASELVKMLNQIRGVNYTQEIVTSNQTLVGVCHEKWNHSLVVLDERRSIGVVMGYEREAEGNEQYPENTLYIGELAVMEDYQRRGIGRALLRTFLDYNKRKGFLCLTGDFNFSIQTNSAPWNQHVQNLYKFFGFSVRTTVDYPNRTDFVLGFKPT